MQYEKSGGNSRPLRQIEQFRKFIDTNGLLDLGWKAQFFTRSNRHIDESFIEEQLDVALANREWIAHFGGVTAKTILSTRFDHLPLLLSIKVYGHVGRGKSRPYRFDVK